MGGINTEANIIRVVKQFTELSALLIEKGWCVLTSTSWDDLNKHGSQLTAMKLQFEYFEIIPEDPLTTWIVIFATGIKTLKYFKGDGYICDIVLEPGFIWFNHCMSSTCFWFLIRQNPCLTDIAIMEQDITMNNLQWILLHCPTLLRLDINLTSKLPVREAIAILVINYKSLLTVVLQNAATCCRFSYDAIVMKEYVDYANGFKLLSASEEVALIRRLVNLEPYFTMLQMQYGKVEFILSR